MKGLLVILLVVGLATAWNKRSRSDEGISGSEEQGRSAWNKRSRSDESKSSSEEQGRSAWNKRSRSDDSKSSSEEQGRSAWNKRSRSDESKSSSKEQGRSSLNERSRSNEGTYGSQDQGTVFKPEQEYIYKYETQVLTGVPNVNTQYSGLKIIGTVRAQIKSDFTVICKLENVEVYQINREVSKIVTTEPVPTELFTRVSSEQSRTITQHLIKPFSFRYESGHVTSIQVPAGEPSWCFNLRRGIINLFQIDLTQRNPIRDSNQQIEDILMNNNIELTGPIESAYRVMEPGVSGECESIYAIVPGREMKVTKVRNFDNCKTKPIWQEGIFNNIGILPMLLNKTRNGVDVFSSCDYVITGDRNNFLIKKAVLTGSYILIPTNPEYDRIVTTNTVQVLKLESTRRIGSPINPAGSMMPLRGGLIMRVAHSNIPTGMSGNSGEYPELNSGSNQRSVEQPRSGEYYRREPNEFNTGSNRRSVEKSLYGEYYTAGSKIQVVEALLTRILSKVHPIVTPEASTLITKLVMLLRECSSGEIETLLNTHVIKNTGSPESSMMRELILDVLPALPQPEVIPVVTRLIRERIITAFRGAYMINLITLTIPPSPQIITKLVRSTRESIIRENPQVFRSVVLGIGTLTSKLAVSHRKLGLRTSINPIVEEIRPVIEKLLRSSVTEEKLLALKTIGNAGLRELLPIVLPMIKDRNVPVLIRTHAIYACRKIAPLLRNKIQTLLLPIFMNPMETHEVRIACFLTIMDSRPFYSTIQTIAHQLNNETSMQVESFVYSYIHTLSTVKHPGLLPVVKMARKVLLITKPVRTGFLYSKAAVLDIFSKSLDMGAMMKLNMINSPRSLIPEALVAQLVLHTTGQPIEAAEIGIEGRGLSAVVRNILGPNSIVADIISGKASLNDIFSPSRAQEWGPITEEIKKMMRKVVLPEEAGTEKDLVSIYFKLLGNELRFLSFDLSNIRNLISTSLFKVSEIDRILREGHRVNVLKTLPLVNNAMVIPTEAGIPITFNMSTVTVVNINGLVKLEGLESLAQILTRPIPETIRAVLDINLSAVAELDCSMGVDLTFLKSGVRVRDTAHVQLPIKTETTINTRSMTAENICNVPKQEIKVLSLTRKTHTFIATTPLVPTSNVFEVSEKEITNPVANTIPIAKQIECPLLGVKFVVDGVVTIGAAGWSPFFPYSGKQSLHLIIKPGSQAPSQMKTTISYGRLPERTPVKTVRSWSWLPWGSSSNQPNYRSAERETSANFRPITPFRAITTPITKKIFVTIEGVGGGSPQIYQKQITWIHSPMYKKHHLNIQMIGNNFKIMTDTVVDLTKIINYPRTGTPTPETVCKLSLMYGRNSFEESSLIMKVVTGETGVPLHAVFLPVPQTTVTPTVYTLSSTIEYRNIPSVVLPPVLLSLEAVKVNLFPWMRPLLTTTPLPVENNKINIVCRIIPSFARVTAAVITPLNINYILDVPITTPLLTYAANIISPYPMKISIPGTYPHNTITRTYPFILHGECKLNNNNLNTFDGVNVNLPSMPETCEVILTRDCSPEGLFTLISTAHTMQPKTIKLMIPRNKIEITPSYGQLNVIVNGIPKSITPGTPTTIRENGNSGPIIAELLLENGLIAVNSNQTGITVITDGIKVITKVHATFRGKTCGLCGNFDGEKSVEHTPMTTNSKIPQNPANYITRYIIPSNSCPTNTIMSIVPKGTCNKVRRNIVINKNVNGVNNKCFTINPVPICSTSCRPTRNNTESLPVHCMPTNNAAFRLEEECKNGIVYALASKPVTTVVPIGVPEKCVPVY